MRGFGHSRTGSQWNSWFSAVKRARVEVVERLDHPLVDRAGPAEVVGGEVAAASAVAVPSRMLERLHAEPVLRSSTIDDPRPDVALERDEALRLELADRLAHRHDAHVELARDRAEHEPVAGRSPGSRCAP